jgi:hypothetical protein
MDFIRPFPESKGFNYLWVVICRLSSMVHLVPMKTTTTATELAVLSVRQGDSPLARSTGLNRV